MAKVYDALKQVEAERSRQRRAPASVGRVAERGEPTLWKRWSERFAGRGGAGEAPVAVPQAQDHMDTILSRLDACERLAHTKLPQMERNLLQLVEGRIEAVEREVGTSISLLGNQMRHDVAVLNRRLTLLLGAVVLLLIALLLRT